MRKQNANDIINTWAFNRGAFFEVLTPDGGVIEAMDYTLDATGNIFFYLKDGRTYSYNQLGYYNPMVDGAVSAIRIFLKDGHQPMATLAFAFGGSFTFEWDRHDIRRMFEKGINAYTIIYDTRAIHPFTSLIRNTDDLTYSWPALDEGKDTGANEAV